MKSRSIIILAGALLVSSWSVLAATPGGGDEDLAELSIENMVDRSSKCVRRMEKQLGDSFQLLEESIAQGDVAATTARNEAITGMKGLVKLSEQNLLTLQQRSAERDRQLVEHEYVKISIACAKVGEFYAQIKSATGVPVDLELADVERKLDYEGKLPVVETLSTSFADPTTPADVPDPPPHASPYF